MHTIALSTEGLSDRTRRAVDHIVDRRGGRPLTIAEFDELLDVIRQGEAAHAGDGPDDSGPADAHLPMQIGIPGAILHRPTYQARIRLIQADTWPVPPAWQDCPAEWINLVAAFILAHAYDTDVLAAIAQPAQAQAVIEAWAATLPATCTHIADAVHALTDGAYPPVDGDTKKKTPSALQPLHQSSAPSSRAQAAPLSTGSATSPNRTSAGYSAKSSAAADSKTRQPPENPHPSTPTTHASPHTDAGASCLKG